ncbi:hypothetical protein P280DRAFT_532083 [Massarina eburnea CBS 473.64]|uniref:RING-type domain-containing protein n=1 Tax=Massarina eburnea CBS 473.64 TaxID=1395130 RepID=A0A6A6SFQ3_9PLEO|nr:hypothetical protein P280DRAFT_532083 [Massarina eburnea CBS 473.64]
MPNTSSSINVCPLSPTISVISIDSLRPLSILPMNSVYYVLQLLNTPRHRYLPSVFHHSLCRGAHSPRNHILYFSNLYSCRVTHCVILPCKYRVCAGFSYYFVSNCHHHWHQRRSLSNHSGVYKTSNTNNPSHLFPCKLSMLHLPIVIQSEIVMAPTAFERCAFKMRKNPKYECAREGKMYQSHFGFWYCAFHDEQAKDRCQAFLRYQGSGMQCSMVGSHLDEAKGLKYCARHLPSRVVSKSGTLKNWGAPDNSTMDEGKSPPSENITLNQKDRIDHPTLEGGKKEPSLDESVKDCVKMFSGVVISRSRNEKSEEAKEDEEKRQRMQEGKNSIHRRERRPRISLTEGILHRLISLETGIQSEKPNSNSPPNTSPRPGSSLSRMESFKAMKPEQERPHIATMYVQCNICLEKHASTAMSKIDPCGHLFREACLQQVLRRGNGRRYNCSSCRDWMVHMQENHSSY